MKKIILLCDNITKNQNQYQVRFIVPMNTTEQPPQGQIAVKAMVNMILPTSDKDNQVFDVGKTYEIEFTEVHAAGFPKKK